MKSKPCYAFIDSQNLNLGIKSKGWRLDFKKFRIYLKNKYGVERAYLFIGFIPGNEKLYSNLKRFGYILIFKPVLEFKEKVKGNVDAELVLHCILEMRNYGKAIIVSGDGDFYCLVEYLESKGKLLNILVPTKQYSSLLRRFNKDNYIVRIDLLRESLEKKDWHSRSVETLG